MKVKKTLIAFAFLGISLTASGASFDCSKASTSIEKSICSNRILSELDDGMKISYQGLLDAYSDYPDSQKKFRSDQRVWVGKRNKCQDDACIESLYVDRLEELCGIPVVVGVQQHCFNYDSVREKYVGRDQSGVGNVVGTSESIEQTKLGGLDFMTEPCENVRSLVYSERMRFFGLLGFFAGWQHMTAPNGKHKEYGAEPAKLIEAIESSCKPGLTVMSAADAVAARSYGLVNRKHVTKIVHPSKVDFETLHQVSCGLVVNIGGSIRPNVQVVQAVTGVAHWTYGYARAFALASKDKKLGLKIFNERDYSAFKAAINVCVDAQENSFIDVFSLVLLSRIGA